MNPKSNESGYSSIDTGLSNLSLGNAPPMLSKHQNYGQPQQSPNFSGEWSQGLAQGQQRSGNQVFDDNDDEQDDQPLSHGSNQQQPAQQQQQNSYFPRPVSIRNMAATINSAKPSNFIKPAAPQSNKSIIPQDMHVIQDLYESYSQKVYFEGYVYKKNDLTVDGKSFSDPNWSRSYVELCGPVLTLWDTEFEQDENVMPQYINITDSNVEFVGHLGELGRENVFSLNSAGANRYFIDVPDYNTLVSWVCAIRLSCFECSRVQEIYTRRFIIRPTYLDVLSKPMTKMEGFVQVRFIGTTEWQKFWVVVSDRKEEKKLFGKKSVQSRGQMMFYESKKAKSPVMTMVNVVQAYTIYPESPQLIDLATMLKVEGHIKANGSEQQSTGSITSVLIMASSPKELVQWIIGTYDAFKIYGRPAKLNDEPNNINSLNFGEPMNGSLPRLFLEVPEVIHVNFKDENLLDNKAQFAGILLSKMQQQSPQPQMNYRQPQQPMGLVHQIPSQQQQQPNQQGLVNQIPSGQSMYNNSNQSPIRPNSQRMSTMPGYANQQNMGRPPMNTLNNPSQQRLNQVPPASGRAIYASDEESEEEDEEEEEEEEDSDHDSVFKQSRKQFQSKESLTLPTMLTEDDGFASSILGDIEKKSLSSPTTATSLSILKEPLPNASIHSSSNTSLPISTKDESIKSPVPESKKAKGKEPANVKNQASEDEFGLSDSEDEAPRAVKQPAARRPKPKMSATQVSLSGSDEEDGTDQEDDEEDDDEGSYSGSDDVPIHKQGGKYQQQQQQPDPNNGYEYDDFSNPHQQQHWENGSMAPDMYPDQQQYYDEDGYPIDDEDGPIIPQLGDNFATQNSLLDTYRPDHPSARDQEGYARATGQTLIQVPNKPPEPRAGLVGMISQIENEKKHKDAAKNRFADLQKEGMVDRERERYMMEQRAQMMPMMGQGMGMMGQPMMDPRMSMMYPGMMGGQMPMMNMMDPRMSMMYPGMMQQNPAMGQQNPAMGQQNPAMMQQNPAMMQQNPAMMQNPGMMNMNMQMMPPMMDPRMSMMMMQQQYGQYPMWNQQQAMFGNSRFNGHIQEDEEDDEDDDVPLGAKDSPIPRHNN